MATNKIRLSMLTEADLVALLGILNDDVSLFPSLDCEAPMGVLMRALVKPRWAVLMRACQARMGGADEGACGRRRIRWKRS